MNDSSIILVSSAQQLPAAVVPFDDVAISIFRQLSGLLLVFCLQNISREKSSNNNAQLHSVSRPDRRAIKMRHGSTWHTSAFVTRFLRYSTSVVDSTLLVGRHLVRMLVLRILMRIWVLTRGRLLLQGLLLHCLSRDRRWLLRHHAAEWPLAHLLIHTL
ncbi:uncharacterized protein LOC116801924 [Drosophila sechellia]|uniref:uncharacterized protein LOC116801924 n=1 Tax=Drosophila sechellia TaxID=7238 RepID=UPI0013DD8F06|nr:uncharacterized protein LOC116801924 [Drosophila sechellia]